MATVTTAAGNGQPGFQDGTSAQFNQLGGVASDGQGNIYIADTYNHCIRKYNIASKSVTTIAGTHGTSGFVDGNGTSALFNTPYGITYNPLNHLVYVADTYNHAIRSVDSAGNVITVAGNGSPGFVDGWHSQQFNFPYGISFSPTPIYYTYYGAVYVADTMNNAIRVVTFNYRVDVNTVVGTPGGGGYGYDYGYYGNSTSQPSGVVEANGVLFVADTGSNTIKQVTFYGAVLIISGIEGQSGWADGDASTALFNGPFGITYANGSLFVTDSKNNKIRQVDPTTGYVKTISGQGVGFQNYTPGSLYRYGISTCFTHVPHGYPYNYVVNISGTTYYDGTHQIQVQASNVFTFSSSNTQTVATGTVSGLASGSSGGGGYTGSPGDGTSGATCYADPSVQSFTDLGPTSNASGYVTVSLVNPQPLVQSPTWNQTWTDQPSVFPYQTTWSSVAYGNGTYVSVSNNGTYPVTYSTDGINWNTQTYGSSVQPWVSVTLGNGIFAAVASDGSKMVSSDGIHWKTSTPFPQVLSSGLATWSSIAYGAGLFVAANFAGVSPHLVYSPDASSWTAATSVPDIYLYSVVYANGLFVALAPFGPTYTFASTDGVNWTAGTAPAGVWLSSAYGNGLWVAVGSYSSPHIMTSTDGTNWTAQIAPSSNWNSVTYGNGLFVATSNGTFPYVMTSPDGINWTPQTAPSGRWRRVVYGNGIFVSIDINVQYQSITSPDGINWTQRSVPVGYWYTFTYANGLFVAISGGLTGSVMTSTDGINWTTPITTPGGSWNGVTYGDGLWVALSDTSPNIMTSPDTISWTVVQSAPWSSVTSGNGLFVATSTDIGAAYSTDGLNYTPSAVVQPDTWSAVTYGDGKFLAVANNGTTADVMYSTDGNVWSNSTTGTIQRPWSAVTYGNGEFVTTAPVPGDDVVYTLSVSQRGYGAALALNYDGSILAVGDSFANGLYGNVYVYTNGQLSYSLGVSDFEQFGESVALSYDGSILAIGAPQYSSLGRVYVYTKGLLTYTLQGTDTSGFGGGYFGGAVALSSDGSILAVGAPYSNTNVGNVYVYTNGNFTYSLQGLSTGDLFGSSVSLSSDGSVLAVGAIHQSYFTNTPGQVYVYRNGVLQYNLTNGIRGSGFGFSVSLSADGSILAVVGGGTVYEYKNGTKINEIYYTGEQVALSADGTVLISGTFVALSGSGGVSAYGAPGDTYGTVTVHNLLGHSNVMYSVNGQDWVQGNTIPFTSNCIAYGNGYFAVPSNNQGSTQVAVISNVANTWQYSTVQGASYRGITYGTRGFVGVSPTKFTLGFTPQFWINPAQVSAANKLNFSSWNGLTYGNGTFVAVGNGLIQGTQDQGTTWNSYVASNVSCITYSQNLGTFVAVSNTYADRTYTSQDGLNWNKYQNTSIGSNPRFLIKQPNSTSNWTAVTYGNGLFAAAGNSNVMISLDGITWGVPVGASIPLGTSPGIFLPYPISVSSDGQKVLISSLDYSPKLFTNDFLSEELLAPRANEGFGWASAMSLDGTIIAVGAPNANSNVGNVYVYSNGTLSYTLSGESANVLFGSSLALSGNGSILAVGAPGTGYVNVYTNGTLTRTFVGEAIGDGFGWATALSSDGTVFAVSALNIGFGISGAQKVYYTQGATTYTLSGNSPNDGFGWAISLSGDGNVLAVSALFAGYVNVYNNGTFAYAIQDSYTNQFGWGLSTNSDGSVLGVCAPALNKVYVYDGTGTLTNTFSGTGWQVAVSSDGQYVVSSSRYGSNVNIYSSTAQNLNGDWKTIAYGGGKFLSVDPIGSQLTSTVGINWKIEYGPPKSKWKSVTYGNGLFVAVGDGDSPYVMTSPDGINWTARTAPSTATAVAYGNGLFVAVGTSSTFMTSPDGINWTTRTGPAYGPFNQITYGNGLFVAVSSSVPEPIMTSPDGINWTIQAAPNTAYGVTYGNGLFVACGYTPVPFMTSPDGINWTARTSPISYTTSIAYGNGLFVASGPAGTVTSPDGINWTSRNIGTLGGMISITYGRGLFVGIGQFFDQRSVIWTSPDGINWTSILQPNASWQSITYGNGLFVAVALNWFYNGSNTDYRETPTVLASPDGFKWSTSLTGNNVSVVNYNNLWVAISQTSIMYSTTGNLGSWSTTNAPVDHWSSVTYGNGYFMAVSNNGTYPAAYSQDGINWSTVTTGFQATDWKSVSFGQNTFMALEATGATTMITRVTETV